ncbi:MAG: M15 family metallopeptidase [Bacteroidota bacterium]
MKLSIHQQIFVQNIGLLILKANSLGVNLTFGEAYRTMEQQDLYYYGKSVRYEDYHLELISAKKRSNTLNSFHLKRLAVDFNFFINGRLTYSHPFVKQLGMYWEKLDPLNRWGGHFKHFYDAPHFERYVA